jgi:hypothetical protein
VTGNINVRKIKFEWKRIPLTTEKEKPESINATYYIE